MTPFFFGVVLPTFLNPPLRISKLVELIAYDQLGFARSAAAFINGQCCDTKRALRVLRARLQQLTLSYTKPSQKQSKAKR